MSLPRFLRLAGTLPRTPFLLKLSVIVSLLRSAFTIYVIVSTAVTSLDPVSAALSLTIGVLITSIDVALAIAAFKQYLWGAYGLVASGVLDLILKLLQGVNIWWVPLIIYVAGALSLDYAMQRQKDLLRTFRTPIELLDKALGGRGSH